ncbi:GDP-mannose mannosyl hydrolase [Paraburkholderia sp. A1RO-5L]|uniref:GDP-mannose mannosyl hydrolase n=2 Tax=Paraburkholderia TaxID=1822464 RepID=UPI003B7AD0DB
MKLSDEHFLNAIAATPLIAIDLLVSNAEGEYLLGHRINRPAQGYWFVPGGRIRKDEALNDAFRRIAHDELGRDNLTRDDAELVGVYEHFYEDNYFCTPGISTHYVVLGYKLNRLVGLCTLPVEQHRGYRWASAEAILSDSNVHPNTRAYFRKGAPQRLSTASAAGIG